MNMKAIYKVFPKYSLYRNIHSKPGIELLCYGNGGPTLQIDYTNISTKNTNYILCMCH